MRLPSPSRAVSSGAGHKSPAFLQLCAWGSAAALALAVAVVAGRTELGAKRAHAALDAILGAPVEPGEIATAFAIDLGPAGTIEAALTRWKSLVTSQSPLLDNLKPLITVRDGGRSGQELHLIAGPVNSMAGSVRLCAVLATSASCQPTAFEGQRLSVR
jgi:hypothetical protein